LLRRFGIILTAGALAAGGMVVGTAAPAFAATLMTCTGPGSGHSTLSPGISNTPTQQTISGFQKTKGCSGPSAGTIVKGKSTFSNLKTVGTPDQPTCANLLTPSPAGTTTGSGGTVTTKWKNSAGALVGTSTGTLKIKSTGFAAQTIAIIKVTGGTFFASGFTTKAKVQINFTPSSGQSCPTLTEVDTAQAGNLTIKRT
jgi:hypothetical protein